MNTFACNNGIVLLRSADAFGTGWFTTVLDACTLHQPAVVFDHRSGRFVVMWVEQDTDLGENRVFATTTTDGYSWTGPQDVGDWSIDGVSLDCNYSTCLLGLARGTSLDPNTVVWEFTVDAATGSVTLGGVAVFSFRQQRTPPVGMFYGPGSSDNLWGLLYQTTATDQSNGRGSLWASHDTGWPPTSTDWSSLTTASDHPLAMTVGPGFYQEQFGFYVNP